MPGLIDEIPMPIIQCPACQGDVLMPEEMAGLRTVCPLCRATFQAPGVEPSAPESGASEEAEAAPTPRRRRRRGRLGDLPLGEACAASPDISLPSRAGSAIEAVRGPGLAMQIFAAFGFLVLPLGAMAGAFSDVSSAPETTALVVAIFMFMEAIAFVAGARLRQLRSYGLVCLGAVLNMITCIGFIIAIWVFATLGRPEVRAAYRRP